MARQLVLGVDSSTQSTKVAAYDLETGDVVAEASARHPATSPPVSEQEPSSWWWALVEAVTALGEVRRDVVGMSIAGQQHGLVLVDDHGAVVRPAKLWNDTTSASQADRLVADHGPAMWADAVGSVPVASFTITKLAWMHEHEPEALRRASRLMLPHDHLTWRLTDAHVTDRGDASGTGWYDPVSDVVRRDLMELAAPGWDGAVPLVLGSTEPAGSLTGAAAAALGLPDSVVVGPGTGDNMAAALGLGLRPGDVAISLGTSGTVFAVSPTPTHDTSGSVAGFASATGDYLPLVCTLNATKITATVASWLGVDLPELGRLALSAAGDAGDVVLIPYFDGERTPNLPDATGSLIGLTTETTAAQVALAAHDGVICGLLDGFDALVSCGATADGELALVGGGSRSEAYRQRVADIAGRTIRVPHRTESVVAGAAVQAVATVAGRDPLDIAAEWRLAEGDLVEPGGAPPGTRSRYAEARRRHTDA